MLAHATVVAKFFINLIAHHDNAFSGSDIGNSLEFVGGIDCAGGIGGRIDNDQLGAVGDASAILCAGRWKSG